MRAGPFAAWLGTEKSKYYNTIIIIIHKFQLNWCCNYLIFYFCSISSLPIPNFKKIFLLFWSIVISSWIFTSTLYTKSSWLSGQRHQTKEWCAWAGITKPPPMHARVRILHLTNNFTQIHGKFFLQKTPGFFMIFFYFSLFLMMISIMLASLFSYKIITCWFYYKGKFF